MFARPISHFKLAKDGGGLVNRAAGAPLHDRNEA
jgi:hypothetical protein